MTDAPAGRRLAGPAGACCYDHIFDHNARRSTWRHCEGRRRRPALPGQTPANGGPAHVTPGSTALWDQETLGSCPAPCAIVSPFVGRLVYREAARPAEARPPMLSLLYECRDEHCSSADARKRLRLRCRDKPRLSGLRSKQSSEGGSFAAGRYSLFASGKRVRSERRTSTACPYIRFGQCRTWVLSSRDAWHAPFAGGEAVLACKEKNGFLSRGLLRKDCDGTVAFLLLHYSPAIRTALQGEPSAPARFRGAALRK